MDVSKGETSDICLHNLITSLVVKNPVYGCIVNVMRASYSQEMNKLELEITKLTDKRSRIASKLKVNEWKIGRKILESQMLLDDSMNQEF